MPNKIKNLLKRHEIKIQIGIGILLSLVFAQFGKAWIMETSLTEWQRRNPLPHEVWSSWILSKGFSEVSEIHHIHKICRHLTKLPTESQEIWISENPKGFVAYFEDVSDHSIPRLFKHRGSGVAVPKTWTPWGSGWSALSRMKEGLPEIPVVSRQKSWTEPREIRY